MDIMMKQFKKRKSFHIVREAFILESIMPELPKDDVVYKLFSYGNFSSIAFIRYVSEKVRIDRLYASSLRIGAKHITALNVMRTLGKLGDAEFIVGSIMKEGRSSKTKGYFDLLEKICGQNNWKLSLRGNHSKVVLMDTKKGKFVLETSSNLNENPNSEQFSFENDEQLFDFYVKCIFN